MRSLVPIAFFLTTTVYTQQVKIQEANITVEKLKDSIDRYFCTLKNH
jgi:hypothetical protein